MFEVCFETVKGHGQAREVKLDMKHGVEARNYDDIAKAEKLKPMEVRKWVSYRVCNCWASASLYDRKCDTFGSFMIVKRVRSLIAIPSC